MRRIAFLSLMLFAGACKSRDAVSPAGFSSKDSAGVTIITNTGSAGRPDSLLSFDETLRIGVKDENAEGDRFFRVTSIALDDAGLVYVGDQSATVRVFDAAGKLLRTIGHKGRGPGEFENISAIFLHDDTVEVLDGFTGRIEKFDSAGKLIGEERTRSDNAVVMPIARAPDAWIAAFRMYDRSAPRVGMVQDTYTIRRISTFSDAIAMGAAFDTATTPSRGIRLATQRIYLLKDGYAQAPLWDPVPSISSDASGRVYTSDGARYAISTFDANGKLVRRIERAHTPVPVPEGLEDKYFAKVKSYNDTIKGSQFSETGPDGKTVTPPTDMVRKTIPHGNVLPTLGKMLVSREGAVWVQRPDLSDEPMLLEFTEEGRPDTYWDVFGADGRYRGTVKIPKSFSSRTVTANAIFGVSRDANDIESVVAYTLKK